jgi:hypothetical protein
LIIRNDPIQQADEDARMEHDETDNDHSRACQPRQRHTFAHRAPEEQRRGDDQPGHHGQRVEQHGDG